MTTLNSPLYSFTGPNDRCNPPDEDWDELCLAAKLEALDELTKDALIERLVAAETEVDALKYEARYWRLRCVKGGA